MRYNYQEPDVGGLIISGIICGVIGLIGGGALGYYIAQKFCMAKTGVSIGTELAERLIPESKEKSKILGVIKELTEKF